MTPPEFLTPEEEKALARMVETNIDFAIEQQYIHEMTKDDESECVS